MRPGLATRLCFAQYTPSSGQCYGRSFFAAFGSPLRASKEPSRAAASASSESSRVILRGTSVDRLPGVNATYQARGSVARSVGSVRPGLATRLCFAQYTSSICSTGMSYLYRPHHCSCSASVMSTARSV